MRPNIIFPAETWAVYAKKLIAELQTEAIPFLRDEMRRLLEMIVELTPPSTSEQGRKRVGVDINQVVRPLVSDTFRSPSVKALIERRDVAGFAAFAQNVPSLRGSQIVRAEDIPELHRKARDTRGRVLKRRFVGNFVWGDGVKQLRDYIARKKNNVGMAIAGWIPALYFLGGSVTKPVTILDVPEHGSFRDKLSGDKPSLEAINATPWASRRDEGARIIRNSQAARAQAMMARLKHIVEGKAHASAKRAA